MDRKFYVRIWFSGDDYFAAYREAPSAYVAFSECLKTALSLYEGAEVSGINVKEVVTHAS